MTARNEYIHEDKPIEDVNGLKYELVGDYYLVADDDEPQKRSIGIWGQRHLWYLKQHRIAIYTDLLTTDKLNEYLADVNEQAEKMFFRFVKEFAEKDRITEKLKAEDQMLWVQRMNALREMVPEIINRELIYA